MLAVIHQRPGDPEAGAFDVAGKQLAIRQLQYLRAIGARRIAFEHSAAVREDEIAAWLVDQALASFVELVPTTLPLGPLEVARRALFPSDERIIALPATALFDADLSLLLEVVSPGAPLCLVGVAPSAVDLPGAELQVAERLADLANERKARMPCPGWGVTIRSQADALALGLAALDGQLERRDGSHAWSIQIHASEVQPGVWVGRGATVSPDAHLVRPVLVGPNAVVKAGASVYKSVIGTGSVLERGVDVSKALVMEDTVVGEGLSIENIAAGPLGLVDLFSGECFDVDDQAMLAPRSAPFSVGVGSRLTALVLLLLLMPAASVIAVADVARGKPIVARARRRIGRSAARLLEPSTRSRLLSFWLRLVDVPVGRRALVGVTLDAHALGNLGGGALVRDASRAIPGALSIDDELTPLDRSNGARLRGMAWYALAKSTRADASLVLLLLKRRRASALDDDWTDAHVIGASR